MTRRWRRALASLAACCAALATTAMVVGERHMPTQESERGRALGATSPAPASDSMFGVFEGRTPCGPVANDFTGFPAQNCEKIKWRLALFRDPSTGRPTTYLYEGTRTTHAGTWRIERIRTGDGARVVYRLQYGSPPSTLSLLEADEGVLLLMDRELRVLVGDASWSYALNRVTTGG